MGHNTKKVVENIILYLVFQKVNIIGAIKASIYLIN